MNVKTIEYQGQTLRYIHQPDGRVRFNTEDLFQILGVNPENYIETGERDFIGYEIVQPIAFRIDGVFTQWLADHFQDYEIGAMSDGK